MSANSNTSTGEPPERIERKPPSKTNYPAIVLAVLLIVVLAGVAAAYEGGYLNKTTTNTVYECPTGDTCTKTVTPTVCTPATGQTIDGAGSTFVAPLMDQWVASYKNNTVNYDAVGSGTGISDLETKSVDYAASDAPASYAQNKSMAGQILTMPESSGAVAIIYNLPGIAGLKVNVTWLAEVYEGTITSWNSTLLQSLNMGVTLPSQTIIPVVRSDGSGTTYVTTQWLSAGNGLFKATVGYATTVAWPTWTGSPEKAEKGSSGISGYVSANAYTVGYVDLNYALTNSISFAKVQNPAGNFVFPSVSSAQKAIANVTAEPGFTLPKGTGNWSGVSMINSPGTYDYPITTFTYLMFYQQPDVVYGSSTFSKALAESLWNFLNWTISPEGQSYSSGLYFVPLPSFVVAADQQTLTQLLYGGTAVPACA